jgi:hypothetical protein
MDFDFLLQMDTGLLIIAIAIIFRMGRDGRDVSFSVLRQFRCGLSSKISTSLFYFSRAGGLVFDLPSSFAILWRAPCNDDLHRAKPAVVSIEPRLQPDWCC